MIFLSKNGQDEYINQFARGSGKIAIPLDDFDYNSTTEPIVLRGILKHKIMKQCWTDSRTFYYVDTGYFGNERTSANPNGWKYWHRIVKNDLQHGEIIPRPGDRFKKFNKKIINQIIVNKIANARYFIQPSFILIFSSFPERMGSPLRRIVALLLVFQKLYPKIPPPPKAQVCQK